MEKVIMAMSGGVDSSAAAVMLKEQGYEVCGATMHLFDNETAGIENSRTCCSLTDVEDARNVCFMLDIPHYVFNYKDIFKKQVIDRFIKTYENGGTPNPCIDCNKYLKFNELERRMKELEYDYVATGHYAIKERSGDRWILKKGIDLTKDQSYVLYGIKQEQLAHMLFPLGTFTKAQVREFAEKHGLQNAHKRESQDICFVSGGKYTDFLRRYTGHDYKQGDFVDLQGHKLGTHKGIVNYTIGQRKGLGIAYTEPLFVCSKNPKNNTVVLGTEGDLYSDTLTADNINFISIDNLKTPMRLKARTRYNSKEQDAVVEQTADDEIIVKFDKPQRAISRGQAVVLYDGDVVIGGGTIK